MDAYFTYMDGIFNVVVLLLLIFISFKIREFYKSSQTNEEKKEERDNMISELSIKFRDIAEKEKDEINAAAEMQRKIDEAEKKTLETLVTELNKTITEASSKWDTDTKAITSDIKDLTISHTQWAEALTNPGTQGGLAEESLQMLLKSAGFEEGTHHKMQPREVNEEGKTVIPDCYVFLPDDDGVIVIDSKAPMTHYKRAFETSDPEKKAKHLLAHANSYVTYAKNLKDKDYTSAVNRRTPDNIFMYIPNAAVYLSALDAIPDLDQKVRALGVSILPPQLLFAALKTIWLTWKEKQVNENMEEIHKLVYEFQDRAKKFYGGKFDEIGKKIEKVNESWNDAIRSYQRFLGPTLNKIEKKIGIEQGKQTNVPKEIDEEIEKPDKKFLKDKSLTKDS